MAGPFESILDNLKSRQRLADGGPVKKLTPDEIAEIVNKLIEKTNNVLYDRKTGEVKPAVKRGLARGGEVKSKMARFGNVGYKFRKEVPSVTKLKEILNNLEPGQEITKSELSRLSGTNRKTVSNVLQKEFPNLNIGEGSKINIKRLNEIKEKTAEAEYRKLLESGYLEDYKKKITSPKSATDKSLTNEALAKKYFPNLSSAAATGRIERANFKIRQELPELTYPEVDPSESYKRRQARKAESTKFLSEDEKTILRQQQAQKKIVNKFFQKNPEEILNKIKLKQLIDVKLKNGQLDFTPRYKSPKQYINLARSGKLFDEFDITPIRSEKRNIQYPVNKNIGPGKFNQGFIRQVDAYFKKTKGSTDPDVLRNKAAISDFLNDVGIRVEVEGERIGSKVLPAIDRTTGDLPNIRNTLSKLDLSNLSVSGYVSPKTKNIESYFDKETFKPKQGTGKMLFEKYSAAKPVIQQAAKYVPGSSVALAPADLFLNYAAGVPLYDSLASAGSYLLKDPVVSRAVNVPLAIRSITDYGNTQEMLDAAKQRREGIEQGITDFRQRVMDTFTPKKRPEGIMQLASDIQEPDTFTDNRLLDIVSP
jgi:hypothetical protein